MAWNRDTDLSSRFYLSAGHGNAGEKLWTMDGEDDSDSSGGSSDSSSSGSGSSGNMERNR